MGQCRFLCIVYLLMHLFVFAGVDNRIPCQPKGHQVGHPAAKLYYNKNSKNRILLGVGPWEGTTKVLHPHPKETNNWGGYLMSPTMWGPWPPIPILSGNMCININPTTPFMIPHLPKGQLCDPKDYRWERFGGSWAMLRGPLWWTIWGSRGPRGPCWLNLFFRQFWLIPKLVLCIAQEWAVHQVKFQKLKDILVTLYIITKRHQTSYFTICTFFFAIIRFWKIQIIITFTDYLTDPSDSDDADMITSQATQGYSEGLADNEQESEVSSIFGVDPPPIPDLPRNNESHISPLEYSAMLKLYRSAGIIESGRGKHLKDTTPDSGVVADNNNSNSNSNQSTSSSSNQKAPKTTGNSSQNSLLSR